MKYVKNIIILLACIMLAPSVNAGLDDEVDLAERLGCAVSVVLSKTKASDLELEEDRTAAELADSTSSSLSQESGGIPRESYETLWMQAKDLRRQIGEKYVENPRPVLQALENLTEDTTLSIKDRAGAMYHRAFFLLEGIGKPTEEEYDQNQKTAFDLIKRALENDPKNELMQKLLFSYLLRAEDPLALQYFGKLVLTVAQLDHLAHRARLDDYLEQRSHSSAVRLLGDAYEILRLPFPIPPFLTSKRHASTQTTEEDQLTVTGEAAVTGDK